MLVVYQILCVTALIRREKVEAEVEVTPEALVEETAWAGMEEAETTKEVKCCCKAGPCRLKDKWPVGVTGIAAVYHPGEAGGQKCCKLRYGCSSRVSWNSYTMEQPDEGPCTEPEDPLGDMPVWSLPKAPVNTGELEPKSAQHTIHNYCDHGARGEGPEENALLDSLVHEFEENSLSTMAQDLFSLYACVRWAPDPAFRAMAHDELDHGSLPSGHSGSAGDDKEMLTARAVERGQFMPMRCSENIGVYEVEANRQHYPAFERRIGALGTYLEAQKDSIFAARSRVIEDSEPSARILEHFKSSEGKRERWADLLENAALFDAEALAQAAPTTACEDPHIRVDVATASPDALLKDCAFVQRWRKELLDFESRFPFRSFLASQKESYLDAGERVLICFGKRVAGDLHRRVEGKHLLTDTNAVGCHGFWTFSEAADMLEQMKRLWAPPTCQLTELELDMKIKMLEMFVQMNERLFDSLPSMMVGNGLDPEQTIDTSEAQGVTKVAAVASWVKDRMSLHSSKYAELGGLLAESKFKWSVCPIKPAAPSQELDLALGVEDVVVSSYIKDAYKKWTGSGNSLPGQQCAGFEWPSYFTCSVAKMRKDYKEPYEQVDFACPELPLLPPQVQLGVMRTKEATGEPACFLRASSEQLLAEPWPTSKHDTPGVYPGVHPTLTQYEPAAHSPVVQHEVVKLLKVRSALDVHGISRYYGDLGRLCTAEFRQRFPRWCTSSLRYPKYSSLADAAADALDTVVGGVGSTVGAVAGVVDRVRGTEKENEPRVGLGARAGAFASNAGSWVVGLVRDGVGAVVGRAKRRYDAIRHERFATVEAGELVHAASFQRPVEDGVTFDRYLVTTDCNSWDPEEETASEFAWGEAALELLAKAKEQGPEAASAKAVQLAARGEAQLAAAADGTPRVRTHVQWQHSSGAWQRTQAHLHYVNALVAKGRDLFTVPDEVLGFQVELVCGQRKQVYESSYHGDQAFRQCAEQAAKHKGEVHFEDEVVVRATFTPLERCKCTPWQVDDAAPVLQKELDTLQSRCGGCDSEAGSSQKHDLDGVLANWFGAGTPPEMRKEIIMTVDAVLDVL